MAAKQITARELAKRFIEPYVRRGSDLSFLRDMGCTVQGTNGVWITIGGYACGKKYSNDFIVVSSFAEDKLYGVFKKTELYDEIANPQPTQLQLV